MPQTEKTYSVHNQVLTILPLVCVITRRSRHKGIKSFRSMTLRKRKEEVSYQDCWYGCSGISNCLCQQNWHRGTMCGVWYRQYISHPCSWNWLLTGKSYGLSTTTVFHAFTGCDTVSAFVGRSKNTVWGCVACIPWAFIKLSRCTRAIGADILALLERFVILMYDRTSVLTDIIVVRKELFTRKGRFRIGKPTATKSRTGGTC